VVLPQYADTPTVARTAASEVTLAWFQSSLSDAFGTYVARLDALGVPLLAPTKISGPACAEAEAVEVAAVADRRRRRAERNSSRRRIRPSNETALRAVASLLDAE
jgi:hypothetical protein